MKSARVPQISKATKRKIRFKKLINTIRSSFPGKKVAIIVAHPDDETLWAGGTILRNSSWHCYIISLCRREDGNRAPKFYKALGMLNCEGNMGDLDDSAEQNPLTQSEVEQAILRLLPPKHFDLIITHNPSGEYSRHLRHEEIGRATINLWSAGKISTNKLWTFAYEDGDKAYSPRPMANAHSHSELTNKIWDKKFKIITETYGFDKYSFEAQATQKTEAFFQFSDSSEAKKWLTTHKPVHPQITAT